MKHIMLLSRYLLRIRAQLAISAYSAVFMQGAFAQEAVDRALLALPARESIAPAMDCAALRNLPADPGLEVPFSVISAAIESIGTEKETAAFCVVKAYAPTQVQFELRLPTKGYTGRYLQGGCGGLCGQIVTQISPSCSNRHIESGAFAVSFNNAGHTSAGIGDALWAAYSPDLREDFAYGANHKTAVAAKAIITAYYGTAPAYSYFAGCSNGGRQGLMEVQRYPDDFDGVVAGASVSMPAVMLRFIWEAQSGLDAQGNAIITPEAAQLLHSEVMKACDSVDGLEDGQIDDPRACAFDAGTLLCSVNRQAGPCLTPAQVDTARKFYSGPVDAAGVHYFPGGQAYGSELAWVGPGANTGRAKDGAEAFVKYLLFPGELPRDFTWRDWRFDSDSFQRLQDRGALYDAADPALSAFRDAGGKLLLWQGAADPAAGIFGMYDYYQAVREAAGGTAAAREFARLFIIPGVYHCGGGYIAYETDLLGSVVRWVEQAQAPDAVTAVAQLDDGNLRERPVFAHPMIATYQGGDINAAQSFVGEMPEQEMDDAYDWAGSIADSWRRRAR